MEIQELQEKVNYLIEKKGVKPVFFWKEIGAERSVFCRWRQGENRKLTQRAIILLEKILINY
ncbi:hypothetical protein LL033_11855 [Clostridium estertheticum]|uniref:hypothetical protein n=1 Tax=Clostridium estertheticum TaxID=238834 RepID=UPI001C0E8305|nr:hypothetical protein [Clostridium estertheticum]MBU3215846.1 hypothetical protein [Clostridium estertheticum]WAG57801.1 hypothetical protein LL033_11855 [Clostridium estertheticum]